MPSALANTDALGRAVAIVLLGMSLCSWFLIVWKTWTLSRAWRGLHRAQAAFWQAPSLEQAPQAVAQWDLENLLLPLLDVTRTPLHGTLDAVTPAPQRQTRLLRGALQRVLQRLQSGQTVLATIGAVAPFVGLLGTVWGIYHALLGIAGSAQLSLDQIAGPVGEALVMTAAGLVVAIPAVVAFNAFGRWIARMESMLEGFAFDLCELNPVQRES
ncbi:MAG: MotA/TolQ/ExbB proton channel family protein [Rhodoferax sp.]|nr:MAG: MotA/TolQ/ExbB proton channel family protein [Rhodoferax sp.]